MIFGRTEAEKWAAFQEVYEWHRAFTWFPRKLEDGRWVWLERIEQRSTYLSWDGPACWRYRLPLPHSRATNKPCMCSSCSRPAENGR